MSNKNLVKKNANSNGKEKALSNKRGNFISQRRLHDLQAYIKKRATSGVFLEFVLEQTSWVLFPLDGSYC